LDQLSRCIKQRLTGEDEGHGHQNVGRSAWAALTGRDEAEGNASATIFADAEAECALVDRAGHY